MFVATHPWRVVAGLAVVVLAGCGGGDKGVASEEPVAKSVELASSVPASAVVNTIVPTTPTFVVKDQYGKAMAGVPVTLTVGGGGVLTSPPTQTSSGDATSIGPWKLGTKTGANTVTVAVSDLTPLVITVQGSAGIVTSLVAQGATSVEGVVGQSVGPLKAIAKDAFDNPAAGAVAHATLNGGGNAPSTFTADGAGVISVTWNLRTTPGASTLLLVSGLSSVEFSATSVAGAPASVAVVSGNVQQAYAGRAIAGPIVFAVSDQYGNGIPAQTVSFAVTGGGTLPSGTTAVTGVDGTAIAPTWRLGTSVIPQQMRATLGSLVGTADANVTTDFDISVRTYGPSMAPEHQALFNGAAARISAMITGDLQPVQAGGVDLAEYCETPGLPILNEIVDDVIIYASIANIDGPGSVLAQAGPCAIRASGTGLPIIGIMEFDQADLAMLAGAGSLQDVITHEMMHVLGIGTFWSATRFLQNYNTSTVTYVGGGAQGGCIFHGGNSICPSGIPVENTGGAGTANGHWRESVFGSEMMTGYANAGGMPISRMTIGAFGDLGYIINQDAAATYRIPGTGPASASAMANIPGTTSGGVWERVIEPKIFISTNGRVEKRQ